MDVNLFDFDLPEELIAQTPLKDRASSKLLVLNKRNGEINHCHFRDLISFLQPGDTLVLNDTRVIPARLFGVKEDTGASIEILLLKQLEDDRWETLVKPGKKVKPGTVIDFGERKMKGICEGSTDAGGRVIRFEYSGIFNEILDELGQMPLPPYIKERLDDPERYQTVFAQNPGSAAAPTAGLHFTTEYLQEIRDRGIQIAYITLHVGLGTFRPVQVENIFEHHMHAEYYSVTEETANLINQCKQRGGKVIAVGTTVTRTLETIGRDYEGKMVATSGWTDIFIYPGFQFTVIDGLLTNFHLPKSTLVMLVSSIAGRENVLKAYNEAVEGRYRFFSFGDAMLLI
ncbi:tRNA preQ1(34) S-adenosylmethionine ribosyltransferase-isomerase QueA [Ammoniphilus resinae]|uniref:S-adenosylmethionine:tRNA ribosyltransferase-isomerase n=1 Tax=Ammoniphilus resinae TaxID=861532 RepID=A0ABS4GJK6_9BACL|nr:tRNA preQ1(34) S-adenosylmethionine ribosyltransferase-isomerase QueA [Ammoniphilus resinae]MBP1930435.1 S-adenosylmethionine:tRNA ribosyltransferase-isomerase [Ammoniphilus resinae]